MKMRHMSGGHKELALLMNESMAAKNNENDPAKLKILLAEYTKLMEQNAGKNGPDAQRNDGLPDDDSPR